MEKNIQKDTHHQTDGQQNTAFLEHGLSESGYMPEQHMADSAYNVMIQDNFFSDEIETEPKKPTCFGGCSEPTEKLNWLEELNASSERSGKNVSVIAQEAATDAVSAKLEFLLGKTLFHVQYEKKPDGRWENSGRDLVELFDENKPGGERKHRYERLKEDMDGAKVGMVFSEPTIFDAINYVQVFVDMGSTIEEYVVQFQGNAEDFSRLYTAFAESSDTQDSTTEIDYNIPLRFTQDVPLEVFVEKIEESYATDESRTKAGEYLSRLKYDMEHLSKIDEYQKEAQQLATYLEQQMLAQGISHAVLHVLAGELDAYAKGDITLDTLSETTVPRNTHETDTTTVVGFFDQAVHEILSEKPEYTQSQVADSVTMVFDILDGKFSSETVSILSTSPANENSTIPLQDQWISTASDTLHISQSDAELLLSSVSKTNEVYANQARAVDMVMSLDTGHGAIFFALDILTMTEFSRLNNEETVSSVSEYVDKVLGEYNVTLTPSQAEIFYTVLFSPDVLSEITDKSIAEQLQYLYELPALKDMPTIDLANYIRVVELVRILDSTPIDQQLSIVEEKQGETVHAIAQLLERIKQLTEKKSLYTIPYQKHADTGTSDGTHTPPVHESAIGDSPVNDFSVAFSLWIMIRLLNYSSSLQAISSIIKKRIADPDRQSTHSSTLLSEDVIKEQPAEILPIEPAPWLLLSIIWHLAMIREQGFAQSAGSTKQKPKKQSSTKKKPNTQSGSIQIPRIFDMPTGVIYAFSHAMIEL